MNVGRNERKSNNSPEIVIEGLGSAVLLNQTINYLACYRPMIFIDPTQPTEAIYIVKTSTEVTKMVDSLINKANLNLENICEEIKNVFSLVTPEEVRRRRINQLMQDPKNIIGFLPIPNKPSLPIISLDCFIQNRVGLSQHVAPLTGILVANWIRKCVGPANKKISQTVRQFRSISVEGKPHHWIVKKNNNTLCLIDPTHITSIYENLAEESQRLTALHEYAARGLAGILESFLSQPGYAQIKLSYEQSPLPQKILDTIDPDEERNIDFIDPITLEPMTKPVRIQDEKVGVFDQESIKKALEIKAVNPLTNEKCSSTLAPALDIKYQMIRQAMNNESNTNSTFFSNPVSNQRTVSDKVSDEKQNGTKLPDSSQSFNSQ